MANEIFTDENGNPTEINNHPARERRSEQDIARHEQRVSERPTRPTRPAHYTGFIPAPQVYSTLEGDMVSTGVDLYQCEDCGFWISRKMSSSEVREHDRRCHA